MKPTKELILLLYSELEKNLKNIKKYNAKINNYNQLLGKTSYILSGLLESLLKNNVFEWDPQKWIDDSILSNLIIYDDKIVINGVMIWGNSDSTNQWTEPFVFELFFFKDKGTFNNFLFFYGDKNNPEITYEHYKNNPDYWNNSVRCWRFILESPSYT